MGFFDRRFWTVAAMGNLIHFVMTEFGVFTPGQFPLAVRLAVVGIAWGTMLELAERLSEQ